METFKVIYKKGETRGVYGISLVETPATDAMFIALKKEEHNISLKTVNEEKRILCGAVLIPDKPIYRNQGGKEFNIIFPSETIRLSAENFFEQSYHKNSTLEHNDSLKLNDVVFFESWIKEDKEKDKSVMLGFDEPVGTWFASMKVNNEEVWNEYVKTGKVAGFSIDGFFELEEINLKTDKMDNKLDIAQAIKEGFENVMKTLGLKKDEKVDLGSVKTKDETVTIDFEGEELVAGAALTIMSPEGEKLPLPDGEYLLSNDMVLEVENGMAKELKPKEVNAEMSDEEKTQQEPGTTPVVKSEKHTQEVFYQLAKMIGSEMAKMENKLTAKIDEKFNEASKSVSLTKNKAEKEKPFEEMTPLERRRYQKQNS